MLAGSSLAAQKASSADEPSVEQVLSWLPADTEMVTVSHGPFLFQAVKDSQNTQGPAVSDQELTQTFETLPLNLFGIKKGLLTQRLIGKHIVLAVEGGRHFRPQTGLGMMLYEGCSIAFFSEDLTEAMRTFPQDTQSSYQRIEKIQDLQIPVFEERLEEDTWTTFVAIPDRHTIIVASNLDYLTELLARFHGKKGIRALPPNLPEWKYVDTKARFWGLRHYDRTQAHFDPSSPLAAYTALSFHDDQAIGVTTVFNSGKGHTAIVTYLSADPSLAKNPAATLIGMDEYPDAKGLNPKYMELAPGVVQGSYSLEHPDSFSFFVFILMAILGHVINV